MNKEFTASDYFLFFLFLFLSILVITSGGGPDYTHYLIWSEYFSTSNLSVFSDYPKSKNGLPLVHWYYGVGLFTSFLSKTFFIKGLAIMKTSSALLTIINIILFYKICKKYEISKFNFLFFISIAYLMLPGGFYINKYSTETWTIFLTLISIFSIEHNSKSAKDFDITSSILFGITLYFLILIKITNVFLASALLLIFYVKKFGKNKIDKKNIFKYIKILFFGSSFILAALIFLAIYHKLLNGSFFGSAYNLGNADFSYFSITNFKLFEVIFSTWHGLLFYHPFYLLSIIILLIVFFKKNLIKDNSRWIVLIVSMLTIIHLIIHSSLSAWWWGLGTYGARGLSGVSILTFYAILNIKDNFKSIKLNTIFKILILLILAHQTYMLSLGETNFYTITDYFSFFKTKLSLTLFFIIIFILISIIIFQKIYKYSFYKYLQFSLISMAFFAAITTLFFNNDKPYLMLSLAALFSYFLAYSIQNYNHKINKFSGNLIHKITSIFFVLLFLYSIFSQTILFSQYQINSKPNFISGKSFSCSDSIETLLEYNNLPNYQDEKREWLNFLKESGCI